MALDWMPRDNTLKDHELIGREHFGTDAPSVIYEERPVVDEAGKPVDGLATAWIWLNNPAQYNSYTTAMVKDTILSFRRAGNAQPRCV